MIDDDLVEWDYGIYEGRTNDDIQVDEPGWSKWDGCDPAAPIDALHRGSCGVGTT